VLLGSRNHQTPKHLTKHVQHAGKRRQFMSAGAHSMIRLFRFSWLRPRRALKGGQPAGKITTETNQSGAGSPTNMRPSMPLQVTAKVRPGTARTRTTTPPPSKPAHSAVVRPASIPRMPSPRTGAARSDYRPRMPSTPLHSMPTSRLPQSSAQISSSRSTGNMANAHRGRQPRQRSFL
jgi:hypothetical protein